MNQIEYISRAFDKLRDIDINNIMDQDLINTVSNFLGPLSNSYQLTV